MGFPIGYTELFIPTLFIHTFTFLTLLRKLLLTLFTYLGLFDFLDPTPTLTSIEPPPTMSLTIVGPAQPPLAAILTRELLPLVKLSQEEDKQNCAVCLYDVCREEEIRWLANCKHIFHRDCLDRWMDLDHRTCPLCRTPFFRDDLLREFNQRLLAAEQPCYDIVQYVDHFNYSSSSYSL